MSNLGNFFKKYIKPQGIFEWFFFGILGIGSILVIVFLLSMYTQTR